MPFKRVTPKNEVTPKQLCRELQQAASGYPGARIVSVGVDKHCPDGSLCVRYEGDLSYSQIKVLDKAL